MAPDLIDLAYLLSASLFIVGLRRLQSPATARGGNQLAGLGMLVAVLATLFVQKILTPWEMIGGLAAGGLIGLVLARRVKMTAMPELVAAFNGFGGLASALVAGAEMVRLQQMDDVVVAVTIALSILIGLVTFSGSFVAFGKLNGTITGNPVGIPRILAPLLLLAAAAATVWMLTAQMPLAPVLGLAALSLVLGLLIVLPIGGADMPVVVALLNSFSGLAAAATGFVLDNVALIVSGALVGASGLILTSIMCVAMNRTLWNVLIGGFGQEGGEATAASQEGKTVTATTADDTAILLTYAEKVIFVPGYGLAVAQAQHQVRELADILQSRGVEVKYAVHPVAGRMPGHMNVLLAEANVPYDQLFEMDEINHEFETTDVSLVIGANDVVNPAARHDSASPIYGMPILDVDKSRTVVFLKRSMRPGYSGVQNELFFGAQTRMLFGDAKDSMTALVAAVKDMQV